MRGTRSARDQRWRCPTIVLVIGKLLLCCGIAHPHLPVPSCRGRRGLQAGKAQQQPGVEESNTEELASCPLGSVLEKAVHGAFLLLLRKKGEPSSRLTQMLRGQPQ